MAQSNLIAEIKKLLHSETESTLPNLLDRLQSLINYNIYSIENVTGDLIDLNFFEEIKATIAYKNIPVYFGKTLRDIKCVISDEGLREHELYIKYIGPKKITISAVNLPHSPLQDRVYCSLEDILVAFRHHVDNLSNYFYELERIDRFCTIMEPAEPSFKDDYRKILLDERTWLHIEVTSDGLATNVHLVGQSELWTNKLQMGLISWDHDKDIIENITTVFDLVNFPVASSNPVTTEDNGKEEATKCGICLCADLIDTPGVPLPLCQNAACGVFFHRNCLFQWLVACAGGRPPAFGVATGSCPACLQTIACSEKNN